MSPTLKAEHIDGILLDIEGTVTPIAFVHEVLFPYARERAKEFLTSHYNAPEVVADIATMRQEHAADVEQGLEPPPLVERTRDAEVESITSYVQWLIERDRKSTGLKSLQGKIWEQGYLDGSLKAQLFDDVAPAFQRWRSANLRISIFSSGSTLAQRLLFAHTNAGDLTRFIGGYFDTTTGAKNAAGSYRSIAASLGFSSGRILFISDVVAELDAASAAEMQTLLCVRPGNQPQTARHDHRMVEDFAAL
jgi:enolase-phosphatase E1